MSWAAGACGVLLIAAFVTDVRSRVIPNRLTITACCAALLFHLVTAGLDGLLHSVVGLSCGFIILLLLFVCRAVGAGDVKLFAAIGAWMGAAVTWHIFMYAIIYGGLIAAFILLFGRTGRLQRLMLTFKQAIWLRTWTPLKEEAHNQATFPFMWAVLPGAVTAVYTGGIV
ncbi:A24 family peptidase [Paenibacillus sp. 481]|uniref:A24 family peptidase n=1 Tax=Paenibacillus sp. 481 TaxID=2835869 RepID=UPI001E53AEDC|nr:A24 family peptidase [Paenibacillus sp. 481]UHA72068.1 prepilin peptidase [Paenibacillus sp. 481]